MPSNGPPKYRSDADMDAYLLRQCHGLERLFYKSTVERGEGRPTMNLGPFPELTPAEAFTASVRAASLSFADTLKPDALDRAGGPIRRAGVNLVWDVFLGLVPRLAEKVAAMVWDRIKGMTLAEIAAVLGKDGAPK